VEKWEEFKLILPIQGKLWGINAKNPFDGVFNSLMVGLFEF